MTRWLRVRPTGKYEGLLRDPRTKAPLSEEGCVEDTVFWRQRIAHGDVELVAADVSETDAALSAAAEDGGFSLSCTHRGRTIRVTGAMLQELVDANAEAERTIDALHADVRELGEELKSAHAECARLADEMKARAADVAAPADHVETAPLRAPEPEPKTKSGKSKKKKG